MRPLLSRRWLALGVALACLALTPPARPQPAAPAPLPPDLAAVPADAAGVICLRLPELWNSPLLRTERDLVRLAAPEAQAAVRRKLGLDLADLERLTIVIPQTQAFVKDGPFPEPHPDAVSPLLVVTAARSFDAAALRQGWAAESREKGWAGRRYQFDEAGWRGLLILNDRTFVLGSEEALYWLLDRPRPGPGPLSPALATAATGKVPALAAFNATTLPEELDRQLPGPLVPLLKTRAAILTLGDTDPARVELRLQFESEAAARDGARAVEAAKALARQGLVLTTGQLTAQIANPETPLGEVTGLSLGLAFLRFLDTQVEALPVDRQRAEVLTHLVLPGGAQGTGMVAVTSLVAIGNIGKGAVATFQQIAGQLGAGPGAPLSPGLKQIHEALEKYHADKGHYPPAYLCAKDGQPLLSWRVALLPYLGEGALYKEFKLDEPWDSRHNKALLARMPKAFGRDYHYGSRPAWKTRFQAFVGPGGVFEGGIGHPRGTITDPLDQTILLAELHDSSLETPWTRPGDRPFTATKGPSLKGKYFGGGTVLMADGKLKGLAQDLPEADLRALVTRHGGEKVTLP